MMTRRLLSNGGRYSICSGLAACSPRAVGAAGGAIAGAATTTGTMMMGGQVVGMAIGMTIRGGQQTRRVCVPRVLPYACARTRAHEEGPHAASGDRPRGRDW